MGRKKEGRTVVFGLPAHSVRVQVAVINTPPQVANDISRHMYHNKISLIRIFMAGYALLQRYHDDDPYLRAMKSLKTRLNTRLEYVQHYSRHTRVIGRPIIES